MLDHHRFLLNAGAGKGFITLRDVAKMATVHDFTWTEEELQDMIRCFDMDKDGKVGTKLNLFTFMRNINAKYWDFLFNFWFQLSLDEFRKIVLRCRMLKES